jgi:hypothetical protein
MPKKIAILIFIVILNGCSTYRPGPVPIKSPDALHSVVEIQRLKIGAKIYLDKKEAKERFGFDIISAGIIPLEVVFDNKGGHQFDITADQTFLKDKDHNLWPLLDRQTAYERASRYSRTKEVFKEGAYHGFLGATAGAVIGAAIGVLSGQNVLESAGKGAAVGAAAGGTLGGAKGYSSRELSRRIGEDLRRKSLPGKIIKANAISYGFLFFPAEAKSPVELRLHLTDMDTGKIYIIEMPLISK